MAESICRTLRDGALEGEHAPALTIKDTSSSPHGHHVFSHVLSYISSSIIAGKSQSRGVVVVSFSKCPSFYVESLRTRGFDVDVASSQKWIHILDCCTDPLGWKHQLAMSANTEEKITYKFSTVCTNVRDMDKLYTSIIELGKGLVGQGKVRFSVGIDSASEMLRHASISKVAGLFSNLRSHEQVSSIFWLLHSDLHEVKLSSALEYISSMVAGVEPQNQSANGQRADLENLPLLEDNFDKGKFNVRFKRRNGRVRIMSEAFHIETSGIKFTSVSSEDGIINQGLLPKVQFNLQLSEKERMERANVILPFEHQGNGKPIQIYDGRRSLTENKHEEAFALTETLQRNEDSGEGKIIYFRDSDDEMPDSDEDPDDDLDI